MKYYKFLPIGSVVRLKGDGPLYMVIQRCIHFKDKELPSYYDYGGAIYPSGNRNGDIYYFNRSQIIEVCFRGFETAEDKKLVDSMNESLKGETVDG